MVIIVFRALKILRYYKKTYKKVNFILQFVTNESTCLLKITFHVIKNQYSFALSININQNSVQSLP